MDDQTLDALLAAWTPDSDMRMTGLILDGAVAVGRANDARPVYDAIGARDLPPDVALAMARVAFAIGETEAAQQRYGQAVAANPTLEDVDLAKAIEAVRLAEAANRPKVTNVISLADRGQRRSDAGAPPGPDDGEGEERALADVVAASFRERPDARVTFADVGGLDEVKAQIRRKIITPFQKPSLFQKFRRKSGGGVLLYGPPGCGKTLLARATAGECRARFINVQIAEVLDMYVGESEKRLSAIFAEARRETPAVLFFDELEALAARRRYGHGDATSSLVSTFLSELDGFEANNEGVLVLAATNVPWAVDAAFRRPGRFDRLQFVPPPDQAAREAVLNILLRDRPGHETIDVAELARASSAFSGADLEHLVDTAVDIAIEQSLDGGEEHSLTMAHMKAALKEVKPTTLEWLTTARNYAKYSNAGGQYDEVAAFLDKHGR